MFLSVWIQSDGSQPRSSRPSPYPSLLATLTGVAGGAGGNSSFLMTDDDPGGGGEGGDAEQSFAEIQLDDGELEQFNESFSDLGPNETIGDVDEGEEEREGFGDSGEGEKEDVQTDSEEEEEWEVGMSS